jgi:hypothetical protein
MRLEIDGCPDCAKTDTDVATIAAASVRVRARKGDNCMAYCSM